MKTVHTDKAPAAIGPYSQAIIHGDTLYTSGHGYDNVFYIVRLIEFTRYFNLASETFANCDARRVKACRKSERNSGFCRLRYGSNRHVYAFHRIMKI